MVGMTDLTAQNFLNAITKHTAFSNPAGLYMGLFTAVGTDAGTGFTEVSGGSYARVSCGTSTTWGAASGSGISTIVNSAAAITFPQATAAWGTVIAWGLFDAATAGNLLEWDFLGNDPWFPCSISLASPGVVTAIGMTAGSSPTLANGDSVVFTSEFGGTLPAAIVEYTVYTVAGLSSDTFNVGQNTATAGSGEVRKLTQQVIPINATFNFATNSATLTAT